MTKSDRQEVGALVRASAGVNAAGRLPVVASRSHLLPVAPMLFLTPTQACGDPQDMVTGVSLDLQPCPVPEETGAPILLDSSKRRRHTPTGKTPWLSR
ncbi:MAG: hypothetical protein QG608_2355 [Actinomycetota bacterium]|nr:hypothetical protein [Actinomycetota bacterium]